MQNIDWDNGSKKRKGGGGGRGPLPPSPVEDCYADCLPQGASGCVVLEDLSCWCPYTTGGGGAEPEISIRAGCSIHYCGRRVSIAHHAAKG
jgi:hypothetical protein